MRGKDRQRERERERERENDSTIFEAFAELRGGGGGEEWEGGTGDAWTLGRW